MLLRYRQSHVVIWPMLWITITYLFSYCNTSILRSAADFAVRTDAKTGLSSHSSVKLRLKGTGRTGCRRCGLFRMCRTYQKLWAESTNATAFLQPWDHSSRYAVCWCIPKTETDHKISVNVSTRYRVRIATRQAEHLQYDFRNIDMKSLNVMSGHTHKALADN